MTQAPPSNASLAKWLDWMTAYRDTNISMGLERVQRVAQRLAVTEFACPVISIAGTNGKGTTVGLLQTLLQQQGLQVASFTSPHLFDFRERITLNGQFFPTLAYAEAFEQVQAALQAGETLSFFEWATLVALVLFKRYQPDIILLEIGLGGRLDAVNCVANQLGLVTRIGLDHCEYLGNTLEAIAYEKAGIARPNVPLIWGQAWCPARVKAFCRARQARLQQLGCDYHMLQQDGEWTYRSAALTWTGLAIPSFPTPIAALVLRALEQLQRIPTQAVFNRTVQRFQLPGRWQQATLSDQRWIFDVAHNPQAATWVAEKLSQVSRVEKIWCIIGLSNNKDAAGVLQPLRPRVSRWLVCAASCPRAMRPEALAAHLGRFGQIPHSLHTTVAAAMRQARQQAAPNDLVIVLGSFMIVGEALQQFQHWQSQVTQRQGA